MMIGPHSEARCRQDLTLQNVKAETDQHIQVLDLDSLQSFGRKTVDKLGAYGLYLGGFDAGQKPRAIEVLERIVGSPSSLVKAKIEVVKSMLSQFGVEESSPNTAGDALRRRRLLQG